jgi:hypothetical protein
MKSIHALVALVIATLFTATFTFAGDGDAHHHEEVKMIVNGETINLDLDDLAEGETRQFFTNSGKEVVVTREADGLNLSVDGEEIELGGPGRHVMVHRTGDGDHDFVFHHDGDVDHEAVSIHLDGDHEWIDADGDAKVFIMKAHGSPAQHLIDSGVLDQVDETAREAILEVLRELEPKHEVRRMVFQKKGEGDDGEE